jgi:hypothetical protein
MQVGFQLVAVDSKVVRKYERESCIQKRNNTQNNTKVQNTQNEKQTH